MPSKLYFLGIFSAKSKTNHMEFVWKLGDLTWRDPRLCTTLPARLCLTTYRWSSGVPAVTTPHTAPPCSCTTWRYSVAPASRTPSTVTSPARSSRRLSCRAARSSNCSGPTRTPARCTRCSRTKCSASCDRWCRSDSPADQKVGVVSVGEWVAIDWNTHGTG